MLAHGTSGHWSRVSALIRAAASPTMQGVHQGKYEHFIAIEVFTLPTLGESTGGIQAVSNMTQANAILRTHIAARRRARRPRENSGSDPARCANPPSVR